MDMRLRDRWLQRADRRLTGAGLRIGAARGAVLETMAREGQCLLSAAEVTERVRAGGAGSAASVYRVLDELFTLGLLHRVDGRDGIARFEVADSEEHHHHFVDEATGDVRPFTDRHLEEAIDAVARSLGVRLSSHEVILRGTAAPAPYPAGE